VARLNFSHGTYAQHAAIISNIRSVSPNVAIMQDLSGPKLRLGEFKEKELKKGQHVIFGSHSIPVGQPIWAWVKPGQTILIDDGLVELIATKVHADSVEAKVTVAGTIKSHKGISLPGVAVHLGILSDKDLADLEFGIASGVDFVAMSFVKTSFDIAHLRKQIKRLTKRHVPIVAKLETPEAMRNLNKIIEAADVVMIARGDLALNIDQAMVPIAQKNIVKKCLQLGKPVIVATQMLDSMIHNPRPTRAEISDVSNAALDHVDAVMLSGESAFGKYPIETVQTMAKILTDAEQSSLDVYHHSERVAHALDQELILAHTLVHFGTHAKINGIVVSDLKFAADISHFRPGFNIILATKTESEAKAAGLLWGVIPLVAKGNIISALKNHGLVTHGERLMDATNSKKEARIELVH